MKPGIKIPAPFGQDWRERTKRRGLRQGRFSKKNVIDSRECVLQALHTTHEALRAVESLVEQCDKQELIEARAAKKQRKNKSAKSSEGPEPPTSITKALRDENTAEAFKWLESIHAEWDGLCEMGVLDHNYTRKQLR